jgi:NAD(P)-dependent dehydrogenase (short-subunit alcohol dehydrogenase family)
MSKTFQDRIALVTGASRGIGRALALELARQGAHVIALARTQGGLEALDDEIQAFGGQATLVPCDVRDGEALDRLGLAIHQRWGRLDVFIGNAAVLGPITPLPHVDPPQFDEAMAINVTANWRLLRSLDSLLRASDSGRVALITSSAGHCADMAAYRGVYAATKAALEALGRTYAAETRNITNVRVTLVDPGRVRTRMRTQLMPGEDPQTLPAPEEIAPKILKACTPDWTQTGVLLEAQSGAVKAFQAPT